MAKARPAARSRTRAGPHGQPGGTAKPTKASRGAEAEVAEDYLERPGVAPAVQPSSDERLEDDQASASVTQQLLYGRMKTRPDPPKRGRGGAANKSSAPTRGHARGKSPAR